MYDITIVFTHHSEFGKCNSDELHEIIESINPDVVFEELPADLFIRFYPENQLPFETPEVKSVRRYLRTHNIDHVPVDIEVSQSLSKGEIDYMFDSFKKYSIYKRLYDEQVRLAYEEGYSFLNSSKSERIISEQKITEKNLLGFMTNKDRLSRIHQLFYEEQDIREEEIIKNVYSYSKRKQYNQGLLLLGSGHRKTIVEKIEAYKAQENLKLNWVLYSA